jgi:hypothetical protein
MLTKVGYTKPMLICTDCGLPMDQRESATHTRQRLWGALTLVTMAMVGAAMLLLASMQEMRRAGFLEGGSERQTEAQSQEGEKGEGRVLLEPSPLVDLYQPSTNQAAPQRVSEIRSGLDAGQRPAAATHPGAVTPAGSHH